MSRGVFLELDLIVGWRKEEEGKQTPVDTYMSIRLPRKMYKRAENKRHRPTMANVKLVDR
jgi:hypothetical protein